MKTSIYTALLLLAIALGSFAMDAPELITPTPGQHFVPVQGTHFAWQPKNGYHAWILQVADNPGMAHPLIETQVGTTTYRSTITLPEDAHLYWRVIYINTLGQRFWSGTGTFWTQPSMRCRYLIGG
jgi:hypothetical protein